jgi:branched-chain amino acid transport system substrate-binding protein
MKMLRGGFLAAIGYLAFAGAAFAGEDLPIGAIGSLSGGATDWGVATQRGVQLAIDEINAAGGLVVGGKTYTPRLIIYDDTYSGQGGSTAATRLVNADKVKYILGPIGTPAVLGALSVTKPAKVLTMHDGFSPKVLPPDSEYNYRISVTTKEFAPPIIDWLKKQFPSARKIALIGPSDATGQQVIPILTDAYKAAGFDIPFSEKYERGLSDFSPLLTRMMAQEVDILDLDSNAPAEAGLLLKQARQLGFKGQIVQIGGPSIEENVAIAGPLAEGFISFNFFDVENPLGKKFYDEYMKKYGGTMSPWCPVMYNGARILMEAIKRSGSVEVDKIREEFAKMTDYDTIFGKVKWGGKEAYGIDHQLMINFIIQQVKDGKAVNVAKVSAN